MSQNPRDAGSGQGGEAAGRASNGGNSNAGAPPAGGAGQASGSSGAAATAAGNGGSAGSAGDAGSASNAGSAGEGGSAGSAGNGGDGGNAAGGANGGAAGNGGGGLWSPNGPKKQWSCPEPPYAQQQMGQATNICQGFAYNYQYNEGPTWIAGENAFFFTNFIQGSDKGGDIVKYTIGGQCEVWLHEVGCNGLGVSPSGNLLAACHGPRALMEYDVETKQGRQLATMVDGKQLDSPNDVVAHSNGTIFFSNTTYELGGRPKGLDFGLVRLDPTGKSSLIEAGMLNGVALSPDETKLYVVGKGVWSLDANGTPGQKMGGAPSGDGIAVDCAGTVTNNGTNSAFGGPDGKTLLVVGPGTSAKTYAMTVPGLP